VTNLTKHEIVIKYTTEEIYKGMSTSYPNNPLKVARWYWLEWWDHRYGPEPEVHTITVDGRTFTLEEIRNYRED
jgi:hypothetical protein